MHQKRTGITTKLTDPLQTFASSNSMEVQCIVAAVLARACIAIHLHPPPSILSSSSSQKAPCLGDARWNTSNSTSLVGELTPCNGARIRCFEEAEKMLD